MSPDHVPSVRARCCAILFAVFSQVNDEDQFVAAWERAMEHPDVADALWSNVFECTLTKHSIAVGSAEFEEHECLISAVRGTGAVLALSRADLTKDLARSGRRVLRAIHKLGATDCSRTLGMGITVAADDYGDDPTELIDVALNAETSFTPFSAEEDFNGAYLRITEHPAGQAWSAPLTGRPRLPQRALAGFHPFIVLGAACDAVFASTVNTKRCRDADLIGAIAKHRGSPMTLTVSAHGASLTATVGGFDANADADADAVALLRAQVWAGVPTTVGSVSMTPVVEKDGRWISDGPTRHHDSEPNTIATAHFVVLLQERNRAWIVDIHTGEAPKTPKVGYGDVVRGFYAVNDAALPKWYTMMDGVLTVNAFMHGHVVAPHTRHKVALMVVGLNLVIHRCHRLWRGHGKRRVKGTVELFRGAAPGDAQRPRDMAKKLVSTSLSRKFAEEFLRDTGSLTCFDVDPAAVAVLPLVDHEDRAGRQVGLGAEEEWVFPMGTVLRIARNKAEAKAKSKANGKTKVYDATVQAQVPMSFWVLAGEALARDPEWDLVGAFDAAVDAVAH